LHIKPKRLIVLVIGIALISIFAILPFAAGTKSYPVAIVDGNSMYPTLHSGDLVFFTSPSSSIKNGTIIVFVQGGTGVSALDSLLKPIVIHRVIGIGNEPDGTPYYQTEGDNNIAPDPFVTDRDNVLGVPLLVIPYAGMPIQFLKTAFGMVTVSALATLYFLSGIDTKMEQSDEKKRLVALFARHSLNGDISAKQFERLQLAVEYYDDISPDLLTDPTILSTIDWLKGGGLSENWKEERVPCPDCKSLSICIVSGDKSFLICPNCSDSDRQSS
jgi:signal peptidase I